MEQPIYRRRVRLTSSQFHPKLELHQRLFHCNGQPLSFERKPLASKIIRAFMSQKNHCLSKTQLVSIITTGNTRMATRRVEQYSWSRGQSLNRLMSRLRLEFDKQFQGVTPPGLHWFHYDIATGMWLLYKLPGEGANGKLYA